MIQKSSAKKLAVNMIETYAVLMKELLESDKCSKDLKRADKNIEQYGDLFKSVVGVLCGMDNAVEESSFSEETIDFVLNKYKSRLKRHKWYMNIKKYPSVAYKVSLILFDLVVDNMKRDGVIQ